MTKTFLDEYAARRFYVSKFKVGANPRLVKESDAMAKNTKTAKITAAQIENLEAAASTATDLDNLAAAVTTFALPAVKAPKEPKAKNKAAESTRAPRDAATAEMRWTPKKLALLQALVTKRATSSKAAIKVAEAVAAGGGAEKCLTNIQPHFDMTVQGYIAWAQPNEGDRSRHLYITAKGVKALKEASK